MKTDITENLPTEGKWVVTKKGSYRKEIIEIAVVWSGNKHGLDSLGWPGTDKIILFNKYTIRNRKQYYWALKVADTLAETLNKKEITPLYN